MSRDGPFTLAFLCFSEEKHSFWAHYFMAQSFKYVAIDACLWALFYWTAQLYELDSDLQASEYER